MARLPHSFKRACLTSQIILQEEGPQPPVQHVQAARLNVCCLLHAHHPTIVRQVGQDEAQQPQGVDLRTTTGPKETSSNNSRESAK